MQLKTALMSALKKKKKETRIKRSRITLIKNMNYNPHEILKPIYSSISILHPSFKSMKEHYRYDKVNLIYLLVT